MSHLTLPLLSGSIHLLYLQCEWSVSVCVIEPLRIRILRDVVIEPLRIRILRDVVVEKVIFMKIIRIFVYKMF